MQSGQVSDYIWSQSVIKTLAAVISVILWVLTAILGVPMFAERV
jgi:hypothetical protein